MEIEKVEEDLEFVTKIGEMNLFRVLENKTDDLLESIEQPSS